MNKCRFRQIHESNRRASDSYCPIRTSESYPKVVGSVCRHRLASSLNVENSRLFARLLTLAGGQAATRIQRETTRNLKCFFYKLQCGLYIPKFNKVKTFFPFPHLNTALSQIQISYWRIGRKLVLQVRKNQINKHPTAKI